MSSQADRAWQLYRALGDIDNSFVAEADEEGGSDVAHGRTADTKGKVLRIVPKVLLVAVLAALPASAIGKSTLFDLAKAKTEGVGATNEEIQAVCKELALAHITPEILSKVPPLEKNEDGLVYGFDSPITDLVFTPTDDGKWGYSYRWDIYGTMEASPKLKLYKMTHTRKMHVYEKDGKTLVGYFTCGWSWPLDSPLAGW